MTDDDRPRLLSNRDYESLRSAEEKELATASVAVAVPAFLPELVINPTDPTATARELAAMFAKRKDFLFNGHIPIRIAIEADINMSRAVAVTNEAVRVICHKICVPIKIRRIHNPADGSWREEKSRVALSKDIAQLYLYGLEGEWGLKHFKGITTSPILDSDGSFRVANGYDQQSGLYCHNVPELNVPERPTEADARAALLRLRRFFRTFPFADSERVE